MAEADGVASNFFPLHRDIRRGLVALRRTLVKQRDAGTPWRAREAAEVLAMLDVTAWILEGLRRARCRGSDDEAAIRLA